MDDQWHVILCTHNYLLKFCGTLPELKYILESNGNAQYIEKGKERNSTTAGQL